MGSHCSSSSKKDENKREVPQEKIEQEIIQQEGYDDDEMQEKPNINVGYFENNFDCHDEEIKKKNNLYLCPIKHKLICDTAFKCIRCGLQKAGLNCKICKFHACYDCFGVNLKNINSKSKYCLFDHPLKFNFTPNNCINCGKQSNDGLTCSTCEFFYLCSYCLGFDSNLYKPNSSKCYFDHQLTFNSFPMTCIFCEETFSNGLKCSLCKSYLICLFCSQFKFSTKSCPFINKFLDWNPENVKCSRCFSNKPGFECTHCLYKLCSICKWPYSSQQGLDNQETYLDPMLMIASGSCDNTIKIWDTSNISSSSKSSLLSNGKSRLLITLEGHTNEVYCLLKLSEDKIASGSFDTTIKIWDISSVSTPSPSPLLSSGKSRLLMTLEGHSYGIRCLIQLSDNKIASGSSDFTINIWDISIVSSSSPSSLLSNGKSRLLMTLRGHMNEVYCLIKLSDNKIVSGSHDTTIKIWDIESINSSSPPTLLSNGKNRILMTLEGHTNQVSCLIKLSDDKIASGSFDAKVKIWDTSSVPFSSSSSLSNGKSRLLMTLEQDNGVVHCLIKLSDNTIASGSGDNTIKIWNIGSVSSSSLSNEKGRLVMTLEGHTQGVVCLIKLSSNTIASGSYDKTIKIWDTRDISSVCSFSPSSFLSNEKSRLLMTLKGHTSYVWCLIKL